MLPSLQYINEGRGGSVIYSDPVSSIRFYFEFGGGDCVAIIFIPSDKNWEKETGRPLAEKEIIVQFVAAMATQEQLGNGRYQVTENFIELYRQ